jgi:hypothetical protein
VALAFVAGSLTMRLLAAPQRAAIDRPAAEQSSAATAPATPSADAGDLYLPQFDPNADLCQG